MLKNLNFKNYLKKLNKVEIWAFGPAAAKEWGRSRV